MVTNVELHEYTKRAKEKNRILVYQKYSNWFAIVDAILVEAAKAGKSTADIEPPVSSMEEINAIIDYLNASNLCCHYWTQHTPGLKDLKPLIRFEWTP